MLRTLQNFQVILGEPDETINNKITEVLYVWLLFVVAMFVITMARSLLNIVIWIKENNYFTKIYFVDSV